MDGVLVIDKPAGMTSHDVVDAVRRRLKTRKVGHAGTLDPGATGILLVGVGKATRFLSYAQDMPKRYSALARFGIETSTQDASGDVIARRSADIDRSDVERELEHFVGGIHQVPPMVSAVKVGGERLYKKALRGEEVERQARSVTVYAAAVVDFTGGDVPQALLDIRCSAGTFIRTLVHDLGAALGCGAHTAALRRTEAGGYAESNAIALERVDRDGLRPLVDVVRGLPHIELDEAQVVDVRHGRPLRGEGVPDGTRLALIRDGGLCAVYRAEGSLLVAERVVPA